MIFMSILTLIMAKSLPSFFLKIYPVYFLRISAIIFIYAGALSFNTLYIQSIGSGIGIYSGLFHVTQISQIIEIFLLIIGFFILIAWPIIINKDNKNYTINFQITKSNNYSTDYTIIVLFSTLGSCLLLSSSDLISMYLSIELQSFGLYILSTLYRDSESSTSAGLKYFFLGLLFKIAAAPLHNWSPDVYDDTPTIVTIWLTIIPKISILILILEIYTQIGIIGEPSTLIVNMNGYVEYLYALNEITNLNISLDTINLNNIISYTSINVTNKLLILSSLFSLIIGTVVGLAQTKIKRLLAYSTISHIGFILLSLAINSEQSIDSFLFYIIQYSITNLNIFLIIIALSYIINNNNIFNKDITMKDIKFISEFKGLFFVNPVLSLCLALCLFSMAGIFVCLLH